METVDHRIMTPIFHDTDAPFTLPEIAAHLKKQRHDNGLTLDGIAEITGYNKTYICKIENGVMPVTSHVVRVYARALNWPKRETDWLLLQLGEVTPDVLRYFQRHRAEYESFVKVAQQTATGCRL